MRSPSGPPALGSRHGRGATGSGDDFAAEFSKFRRRTPRRRLPCRPIPRLDCSDQGGPSKSLRPGVRHRCLRIRRLPASALSSNRSRNSTLPRRGRGRRERPPDRWLGRGRRSRRPRAAERSIRAGCALRCSPAAGCEPPRRGEWFVGQMVGRANDPLRRPLRGSPPADATRRSGSAADPSGEHLRPASSRSVPVRPEVEAMLGRGHTATVASPSCNRKRRVGSTAVIRSCS